PGRIKSHDDGPPAARLHQGGKDAEHRGLAAAIGPQQSEEFGRADIEGYAVQGSASVVTVDKFLNRDHSGCGRRRIALGVKRKANGDLGDHRGLYMRITTCS